MSFRISPTVVITGAQATANTDHITASGAAHSLVKDSTVSSTHLNVSFVTGALTQVDAALTGDVAKKFKPERVLVTCSDIDIPAWLEGGVAATTVIATWNAVTAAAVGEFGITINGVAQDITGLDFAACADMDDVAAVIEAGLVAAFGAAITCTWNTNHFRITSADTNPATSLITVTRAVAAPAATDISGVGATTFMDGEVGVGIPHLPPTGLAATLTVGTTHAGTEILPATVLTGLIGEGMTFEVGLTGLFPSIAGNATLHATAVVGDGVALAYSAHVVVEGTQA